MATTPLSGTNVRLLRNIPFSNDYRHTRWFDTKSQQTSYFLGKPVVHSMSQSNFQKVEGRNFIAVNIDIDSLWGVNYVMFQNAQYSDKWFYAFVTKLEYKQRNTTYLHFEIDVFQTWLFDMNFKPSYIVREHCKLWNSDGTPVVNTIDEGLDYGSEYDTVSVENVQPNNGYKWLVIVCKTVQDYGEETNQITPSVIGTPQALVYYVVPFNDDGDTPTLIFPGGETTVTSSPVNVLKKLYESEQAVNDIVSIYVTDYIGVNTTIDQYNNITLPSNHPFRSTQVGSGSDFLHLLRVIDLKQFTLKELNVNENKYNGFRNVKESKLLMHPYSVTVLDDFKGNRIEVKNEYVNTKNLALFLKGSLGTSNKISWGVKGYNTNVTLVNDRITSNEYALIDDNVNDVTVLNDYLAAFLQGNKNSIHNQKHSILFNGIANATQSVVSGVASGSKPAMAQSGINLVKGAGNTVLELQGIQAKQNDVGNIPPSIAKMGSNTAYDYGNRYNGVWVLKKQLKPEYQEKLEDFFNMYGYKVDRVKVPNFHTRQNWNYVQTASCVITGNFNNEDLQEIKSVFDGGITLWHTDDVGNYSLTNEVI